MTRRFAVGQNVNPLSRCAKVSTLILLYCLFGFGAFHAPLQATAVDENNQWCPAYAEALEQTFTDPTEEASHLQSVIGLLPGEGAVLKDHLESRLIDADQTSNLRVDLEDIASQACGLPTLSASAGAAKSDLYKNSLGQLVASGLLTTESRFEEDALDLWLNRIVAWFEVFFESEGMQFYAQFSRFTYLGILGLLSLFFAWRIWRFRTRVPSQDGANLKSKRLERRNMKNAATYRGDADLFLQNKQFRLASEAGRLALLKHLEEQAVVQQPHYLTHREIRNAAPDFLTGPLQEAFLQFEHHVYGGHAGESQTVDFLQAVDQLIQLTSEVSQ
jgi:hypothetical protein